MVRVETTRETRTLGGDTLKYGAGDGPEGVPLL